MVTFRDELKAELLEKYAGKDANTFIQFDGFTDDVVNMMEGKDADGDDLWLSTTSGLMTGAPSVRVLVSVGTSRKVALRLLKKIRAWLKDGANFDKRMQRAEADDHKLDGERCLRCGCNMQEAGEHDSLCAAVDGTPTALTDDAVRKALAVQGHKWYTERRVDEGD